MEKIRRIAGFLVEPNRHVRSLEETRQIVGFLLRLRSVFLVREVLPQQESAPAARVHLDELVPEPVQDHSNSPNVHAGPRPQIVRVGRAEGPEVPSNQSLLGFLFRRHRPWLAKPSIHPRKRDLLSIARTEAHETPHHGRSDELPGGVGSHRLPSPPPIHPILRLRPEPLREIVDELPTSERAVLETVEDHRRSLFLLQARSFDPSLLARQPRGHETAKKEEEFVRL